MFDHVPVVLNISNVVLNLFTELLSEIHLGELRRYSNDLTCIVHWRNLGSFVIVVSLVCVIVNKTVTDWLTS